MTLVRVSIVLAFLAAACTSAAPSPPVRQAMPAPTISAASYDHSCASVADCAVVTEGQLSCCRAECPNSVIAQAALTAYTNDLTKATEIACSAIAIAGCDGGALFPDGCQQGRVACQAGLCVLDLPGADGATSD